CCFFGGKEATSGDNDTTNGDMSDRQLGLRRSFSIIRPTRWIILLLGTERSRFLSHSTILLSRSLAARPFGMPLGQISAIASLIPFVLAPEPDWGLGKSCAGLGVTW